MKKLINIAGSEITITRVGFGCARVYGGSEFKVSAGLIEAALNAGIRHFDTAPSYGGGESESVLGEVAGGMSDVTITSKVGIPRPATTVGPHPAWIFYRRIVRPVLSHFPGIKSRLVEFTNRRGAHVAKDGPAGCRSLNHEEVLRSLEESNKRLKRDRLDLYLLHEPDQFALTDELLNLFERLQRDRVIGAFGLAYGRVADAPPAFGTVIQSRHAAGLPARSGGQTRIFHGILRHGWHEADRGEAGGGAGEYLARVLATCPDSAVIFSASSPGQIRSIVRKVFV